VGKDIGDWGFEIGEEGEVGKGDWRFETRYLGKRGE
jgi:hypothetical protein